MIRLLAGLVPVVVAVGISGCSSPSAPSKGELAEALVTSGMSEEVAECTASAVTESLTESEIAEITERGSGGAPVDDPEVQGESYDELAKAMSACRELRAAEQPITTIPIPDDGGTGGGEGAGEGEGAGSSTTGAQLNPASSTTTAAP